MSKRIDITGKKFGMLTVLHPHGRDKWSKLYWNCKCDCGNEHIVCGEHLKSGRTRSCGCFKKESVSLRSIKHNLSHSSIYCIWHGMMQRCNNHKINSYKNYGGRGIKVCDKWLTFEGFYEDMGDRPDGMSIDRIDNNGNYCKENCKWSTPKEQANNRSNNRMLTLNGKTKNLTEWSKELGIHLTTIITRLDARHWSVEKALTTKVKGVVL